MYYTKAILEHPQTLLYRISYIYMVVIHTDVLGVSKQYIRILLIIVMYRHDQVKQYHINGGSVIDNRNFLIMLIINVSYTAKQLLSSTVTILSLAAQSLCYRQLPTVTTTVNVKSPSSHWA